MLHLGLDTVELEGKPFTMHVKEDDQVTPDTLLATADVEQIKDAGKDPVVLTLITNTNDYVANAKNLVKSGDQVEVHHNVFEITTK
ncbi:PTS system beta-glucoside-specific EIIBCA component [Lactobacillus helveticus]|uniref:PTS system beta-glucoside-specific EIIBCA component n=1 Tax=Lactobacillus helveticus TaxID=1587 RepID=A0A3S8S997_LACHE|nr:PTS system beta-glucoside-specific EIIBCA component [Lactobacillus helveticus]NRO64981.1 PTS system beta-glucoside-specific EIIBCA component [Lactobacillus helveticus]